MRRGRQYNDVLSCPVVGCETQERLLLNLRSLIGRTFPADFLKSVNAGGAGASTRRGYRISLYATAGGTSINNAIIEILDSHMICLVETVLVRGLYVRRHQGS